MKQLDSGQVIGAYTVVFPLPLLGEEQAFYRVVDCAGNKRYLYLEPNHHGIRKFSVSLRHDVLLTPMDEGQVDIDGARCYYRVSDFISGETLTRRLERRGQLRVYEAKRIVARLLDFISYLRTHSSEVHLDGLSPSGILLSLQDDSVKLLELPVTPRPLYRAPECVAGKNETESSDVYVVGVLFYLMLFAKLPWKATPHSDHNVASITKLDEERRQPLDIPEHDIFELTDSTIQVLRRALTYDVKERYSSAAEMLADLEQRELPHSSAPEKPLIIQKPQKSEKAVEQPHSDTPLRGFAAVAGMRELKAYLTTSVINLLRHTERARRYRIHIPNGMLLYGPPGCGKSFFAEKFAEEVGYSSIYVKASDLASIYVHGSQSKIRELFDEARKKAPTVICFDEFDALAPSRNNSLSAHQYGEVNEFLSQLNNCGQDGIFVIASTNKPDLIDPAVMRRGRIDRVVYLPAPDEEASVHLS